MSMIGGFFVPHTFDSDMSFVNNVMNASASQHFAAVFRAPRTGTLDWFESSIQITNNPDNGIRFSFQGLTAAGDPDLTQDQWHDFTGALATGWYTPAAYMGSSGSGSGSKRSVTQGEWMACVISYAGAFVAGDSFNSKSLSRTTTVALNQMAGTCYMDSTSTAGVSWTPDTRVPTIALRYDDGTYEFIDPQLWPISAFNTTTYNSGSTPDERGLYFVLTDRVDCIGAWIRCDLDGAADVVLYDSNGTSVLASESMVSNNRPGTGAAIMRPMWAPVSLQPGLGYRLVVKPTSVTSLSTYDFDVASNARMRAVPGGQNWYYTSRTDAGAWTEVTTKRPFAGLHLTSAAGGTVGAETSLLAVA